MRVELVRAANPGPFTLEGTNTWVVADAGGVWVIDPGPALGPHLDAVAARVAGAGGRWRGVLLTHDHADHAEGVPALLERVGVAPVHAARGAVDVLLADGDRVGPLEVVATPGHAPDHLAFVAGRLLFSGDAVLGRGSVFVWPSPGALRGYLAALERLQGLALERIHPGHGPQVEDPGAKLAEYLAHRRAREARLVAAMDGGARTTEALLDGAWGDVPAALLPAAAMTLAAHLDKLEEEGRLPDGVQRGVIDPSSAPADA